MFNWICPKCGRDVPPAFSECPTCHPPQAGASGAGPGQAATAGGALPANPNPMLGAVPMSTVQMIGMPSATPVAGQAAQLRPNAPAYTPPYTPPVAPPQAAPQPAAPTQGVPLPPPPPAWHEPPPPKRIPNWLGALIAFTIVGAIAASVAWYTTQRRSGGVAKSATAAATQEAAITDHPYSKDLEVTGFRLTTLTKNKYQVQFLVVNHGATEMTDLGGVITVRGKGTDPEKEPAFRFKFKVSSLAPYSAKEVEVREFLQFTKSRNDMPDWQFYEPTVEITSPAL